MDQHHKPSACHCRCVRSILGVQVDAVPQSLGVHFVPCQGRRSEFGEGEKAVQVRYSVHENRMDIVTVDAASKFYETDSTRLGEVSTCGIGLEKARGGCPSR